MTTVKVQELAKVDIFQPEDKLCDSSATGRERPWRRKKMANELLAAAYDQVDNRKAARLRDCAKVLTFRKYNDGTMKLHAMNSCRVRLCPVCSWRRSLKTYHTMRSIMAELERQGCQLDYLMLTLTVRNAEPDELSDILDLMSRAWNRFLSIKRVDQAVKGWYRGTEVTHNVDYNSEAYNTYHPHFHVLIAVDKNYFKKEYISQADWTQLWKQALGASYTPIVDVRKVRGCMSKAVAEVAKYACKEADYIIPEDWDLTIDTVRLLDSVLDNRRFVAYGKLFRQIKRQLGLEDEETGNLVEVGEPNEIGQNELYSFVHYFWYSGYRQYYAVK